MDNFGILHHKVVKIFIFLSFFLLFAAEMGSSAQEMIFFRLVEALICDSLVTRQKALTLQRKQYKGNV